MDSDNVYPCYYFSSSPPSSSSTQSQLSSSPNQEHSLPQNFSSLPSHPRVQKKRAGRKKFRETRHPVYRGVRQRNGDRWVCEVREPNKKSRIWLGTYSTPEMAARAHDAAVLALRGTSAMFNFPHSVSLLPVAKSSSPVDIRAAAAKAAEAFAPVKINPSFLHLSSLSLSFPSTSTPINHFVDQTSNNYPCLMDATKGQARVPERDHVNVVVNNDTCAKEEIGNGNVESKSSVFFDEEALYNMPGLLVSMAEGLLITPPSMKHVFDWDNVECETDLNLWAD